MTHDEHAPVRIAEQAGALRQANGFVAVALLLELCGSSREAATGMPLHA